MGERLFRALRRRDKNGSPQSDLGQPPLETLLFTHQHDASVSTPSLHHGFQYVQNIC